MLLTPEGEAECWEEIAAMIELSEGPWVTGGDFNTVRHIVERRGCSRTTNVMTDFSKWIEDLELHDPIFIGGKYTWVRGLNHEVMQGWIDSDTLWSGRKASRTLDKGFCPE